MKERPSSWHRLVKRGGGGKKRSTVCTSTRGEGLGLVRKDLFSDFENNRFRDPEGGFLRERGGLEVSSFGGNFSSFIGGGINRCEGKKKGRLLNREKDAGMKFRGRRGGEEKKRPNNWASYRHHRKE